MTLNFWVAVQLYVWCCVDQVSSLCGVKKETEENSCPHFFVEGGEINNSHGAFFFGSRLSSSTLLILVHSQNNIH